MKNHTLFSRRHCTCVTVPRSWLFSGNSCMLINPLSVHSEYFATPNIIKTDWVVDAVDVLMFKQICQKGIPTILVKVKLSQLIKLSRRTTASTTYLTLRKLQNGFLWNVPILRNVHTILFTKRRFCGLKVIKSVGMGSWIRLKCIYLKQLRSNNNRWSLSHLKSKLNSW